MAMYTYLCVPIWCALGVLRSTPSNWTQIVFHSTMNSSQEVRRKRLTMRIYQTSYQGAPDGAHTAAP